MAMDNMCIFLDFQPSELETYYKKLNSPELSDYAVYTGGNFVYVLNPSNKTIRFSSPEKISNDLSADTFEIWLKEIKTKYPGF